MGYSGARGTLLYEKNLMSKISCQTPLYLSRQTNLPSGWGRPRNRQKRDLTILNFCLFTIAGQCRTIPWPAVPDWPLMPECRCRTEAVDYRKKCRCRINFFPAFQHSGIYIWFFQHHISPAAAVYGRSGCATFHSLLFGRAVCILFHQQYGRSGFISFHHR